MLSNNVSPIRVHGFEDQDFVVNFVDQVLDLENDAVYFHLHSKPKTMLAKVDSSGYVFTWDIAETNPAGKWKNIGKVSLTDSETPGQTRLSFGTVSSSLAPLFDVKLFKDYGPREFEMYLDFESTLIGHLMKAGYFKNLITKYNEVK